ncbi:hypothetical protein SUGI_0380000 [Cryptomeria japonica]|nr:hypothetical protein SUGI_0380000 [Cryptomeria japonica]
MTDPSDSKKPCAGDEKSRECQSSCTKSDVDANRARNCKGQMGGAMVRSHIKVYAGQEGNDCRALKIKVKTKANMVEIPLMASQHSHNGED